MSTTNRTRVGATGLGRIVSKIRSMLKSDRPGAPTGIAAPANVNRKPRRRESFLDRAYEQRSAPSGSRRMH